MALSINVDPVNYQRQFRPWGLDLNRQGTAMVHSLLVVALVCPFGYWLSINLYV